MPGVRKSAAAAARPFAYVDQPAKANKQEAAEVAAITPQAKKERGCFFCNGLNHIKKDCFSNPASARFRGGGRGAGRGRGNGQSRDDQHATPGQQDQVYALASSVPEATTDGQFTSEQGAWVQGLAPDPATVQEDMAAMSYFPMEEDVTHSQADVCIPFGRERNREKWTFVLHSVEQETYIRFFRAGWPILLRCLLLWTRELSGLCCLGRHY